MGCQADQAFREQLGRELNFRTDSLHMAQHDLHTILESQGPEDHAVARGSNRRLCPRPVGHAVASQPELAFPRLTCRLARTAVA